MSGADQGHHDRKAALHDDAPESQDEDAHGGEHGGHGHGADPLGPIDGQAWGAALLGVASGVLVAGVMFLAINAG
jgi:hypothetical protein